MFPLDERTVDRVAKFVCDIDGPYERSGKDLEGLLRTAGWADPPEYDGSSRVAWLNEALKERGGDRSETERFLCRICDPLEYDGGIAEADQIRICLNQILEPEQLVVSYAGGRPVIGEVRHTGEAPTFVELHDLEQRLRRLIQDVTAIGLLMSRARETHICEQNAAYGLAVIGIGSLVESLLYSVLVEHDPTLLKTKFRDGRGKSRNPSLQELIHVAHEKRWIQVDAKDFTDKVRDYRNVVHLRHQRELDITPDRDTVMLCWGPVQALLNDLDDAFAESMSAQTEDTTT
jgi:hypothetical protein